MGRVILKGVNFLSQAIGSKMSYGAQAETKVKNFSSFHRHFRTILSGRIANGLKSPDGHPMKLLVREKTFSENY